MKVSLVILVLLLGGCGSKNASHLPSIFELPGAIIGSAMENTRYNAKRKKIERYVSSHYEALKEEIYAGKGEHLQEVLTLANIKKAKQLEVQQILKKEYATLFQRTQHITETTMQAFGGLYLPEEKTKKMNGFTYTEASNMIDRYIKAHYEEYKNAIQENQATHTSVLADMLHINPSAKRDLFLQSFKNKYFEFYEDVVVVSIMIYS